MLLTNFTNIFLILWPLRTFQQISLQPPWKLQNTGLWHLECCYCLTSVLGRRSQPEHTRHSLRMCLHHLLLDTHQSHTTSATWRRFIWMLCYCTKCSIYPAVVFSRWGLWEWFQHSWLTNAFTKNTTHTPHLQHGTCILWPSTHYTLLPSYHTALQLNTNPSKTSALLPNLYSWQFREWPGPRQHTRILRWGRRFPNSTYGWWTLDDRYGTWKNILYAWKWVSNNVCQYPCPYGNSNSASYMDSLDLSDISNYKDFMMTTSDDEELPGLEEVPNWCLNSCLLEYLLDI